MNSVVVNIAIPKIIGVEITEDTLKLNLEDGRAISVPLSWYPRLAYATEKERQNYQIAGAGYGVHWPDLDEDIGVQGLLAGKRSNESPESLKRWLASRRHLE
ncbi:MAG: DUF2442 domain-containing protein [Chloroflexi bacterium]|nr:MAG: DUF2442 domain-containing protein [Chloroflexota bacterium]